MYNNSQLTSSIGKGTKAPSLYPHPSSGADSGSSLASGFTFTQDSHMRIILGTGSPESRPKKNGVTGNPSLKAAQAKAAYILRNGLTGKSKQDSLRPSLLNIKKETPLWPICL